MPLQARIISVSKPGEAAEALVLFTDQGREVGRETISFDSGQALTESILRERINIVGTRLDENLKSETFARQVVGQIYDVERPTNLPPSPSEVRL